MASWGSWINLLVWLLINTDSKEASWMSSSCFATHWLEKSFIVLLFRGLRRVSTRFSAIVWSNMSRIQNMTYDHYSRYWVDWPNRVDETLYQWSATTLPVLTSVHFLSTWNETVSALVLPSRRQRPFGRWRQRVFPSAIQNKFVNFY